MAQTCSEAYEILVRMTSADPIMIVDGEKELNASLAYHAQAFLEFELSVILKDLCHKCSALGLETESLSIRRDGS